MSSILKALRRLEEEQKRLPRPLREEVADAAPVRRSRRDAWIALGVGAALGVVAALAWPVGRVEPPPAPAPAPVAPAQVAPAQVAPAPVAPGPVAAAPPEVEAPVLEPPTIVEVELPPREALREVAVAEPVAPAPRPAPAPAARPAPAPRRAARPAPDLVIPSLVVASTVWHPDAARRLARVRLEGREGDLELREGDAVGSLVVSAIEPSGVVFLLGDMEVSLRVGDGPQALD